MYPNLVGTSGPRHGCDEAGDIADPHRKELRHRRLAFGMDAHDAFARSTLLAPQRRFAAAPARAEVPANEGEIALVHPFRSQCLVQRAEHAASFGDEKTTGSVAIDSMDQLQASRPGPGGAQALDDAEGHPASAVHGPTGGLVQHDQAVVLEENRPLDGPLPLLRGGCPRSGIGGPHRRDAHDVAEGESVVLPHAATVDPNLPPAQQPVDSRTRNAPEMQRQEVVDALPRDRLVHGNLVRGCPARSVCSAHPTMVAVRCERKSCYSRICWIRSAPTSDNQPNKKGLRRTRSGLQAS